MNLEEATKLEIGETIFYEYVECEVKSEVRNCGNSNKCISIQNAGLLYGAHIREIFLPTEHVKKTSNMVAEKRKEFSEMNYHGANINPTIFGLFEDYWINMCSSEGNDAEYQLHKVASEDFIEKLFKVAKTVNSAVVMDIPYLRR